jgi:hypothetical protein
MALATNREDLHPVAKLYGCDARPGSCKSSILYFVLISRIGIEQLISPAVPIYRRVPSWRTERAVSSLYLFVQGAGDGCRYRPAADIGDPASKRRPAS